jgi:AcrR family transcriptional regulator
VLSRGVEIASTEGLEGLTIGRLAADLAMSKSGVLGIFGSKEALQLAAVETATQIFATEVVEPATGTGLSRLRALCEAYVSHLERGVFPGGCFFAAAITEFDDREGPVRDAIAWTRGLWQRELRSQASLAISAGDLPPDPDADQLVFELEGIMLALNTALRLDRHPQAAARARRAMNRLLAGSTTAP